MDARARSHGVKMKVRRFGNGKKARRILLVAPRHPRSFWNMQGTVDLIGATAFMPNSALATLVALTPNDLDIEYVLCDENVSPVNPDTRCDLVAITGGTLHAAHIRELCKSFSDRGVPVALGGTYASICPEECADLADHLFVGEAEYTWPRFLREWLVGEAKALYRQETHIDMADSPAPDWSLNRAKDFLNMSVQTSRGCPNNCDFCDVIQYVGRKYRTKSIDQIIAELDNAHAAGARTIFFSDDNFLGNKSFTRQLLAAIIEWNSSRERPLSFSTQITMQVADDDELLAMFADARFSVLFVGLETVRKESLDEVHKSQNMSRDPVERIRNISRHGIVPFVGLIVGFDNDDETVFDELDRFIDEAAVPVVGISMLNAPRNTPLYHRLQEEGRLIGDDFSGEWQLHTNVIPKQMTSEQLAEGYWRLFRRVYEPEKFESRTRRWLAQVDYTPMPYEAAKADKTLILKIFPALWQIITAPKPLRQAFLRNMKWAYQELPARQAMMFILLAEYNHFYRFVMQGAE